MVDDHDINMEGDAQNRLMSNAAASSSQVVHNPANGALQSPSDPNPAAPSFNTDNDAMTSLLVQVMHRSNTVMAQQILATLPTLISSAVSQALARSSGQPVEQPQQSTHSQQSREIAHPQQQEVAHLQQQQAAEPQLTQPMEIDEDGPKTPQRKGRPPQSPGKKPAVKNQWNKALRKYLEGQHVGLCKVDDPTPTADPERVKAYTLHGRDPPALPNPQLDWTGPPNSPWNERLIGLMARGFYMMVKDNEAYAPPSPAKLRTLAHVKQCISARIKKTRTEWRR
ncbi:hypothetical protein H1R20_g12857, partial [Candolleomyces eurysporus]